MTTSPGAVIDALHAHEDGLDIRRRDAVKRLGLQQRGHPIAGHIEAVAAQFRHLVLPGLVPGQQHVEQIAVDHDVFEIDRGPRGKFSRQTRGERRARFGGPGAYRADDAIVGAQLDLSGDQIESALIGIAFLEQQRARRPIRGPGSCGRARAGSRPSGRRAARRSLSTARSSGRSSIENSSAPMPSTL